MRPCCPSRSSRATSTDEPPESRGTKSIAAEGFDRFAWSGENHPIDVAASEQVVEIPLDPSSLVREHDARPHDQRQVGTPLPIEDRIQHPAEDRRVVGDEAGEEARVSAAVRSALELVR